MPTMLAPGVFPWHGRALGMLCQVQPEYVVEDIEWAVALKVLLQEGDILSVV
jgi:hypothetical protein